MKLATLVRAGVLTGITDGLFSSILAAFFYHSSVTRLFQGVAATVFGSRAFDGGRSMAVVGVLMHVGVAFAWSAVFMVLVARSSGIRAALRSPAGIAAIAAVYGPLIWTVMSLAVIPLLTQRPTPIGFRWWVQFIGHAPFVGLPIAASFSPFSRPA